MRSRILFLAIVFGCLLVTWIIRSSNSSAPLEAPAAASPTASLSTNANQSNDDDFRLPQSDELIEVDPYESADAFVTQHIKETLPTLGLEPLPNTGQPNKFELRLWTNIGARLDEKLFVIRFDGVYNNATSYEIKKRSKPYDVSKSQLSDPKSSWNGMFAELKNRLKTPTSLSRDPQFDLGRDEAMIILEVLYNGEYRRVLYGHNTSFADGKRLMALCDYLAAEFDANMNCNAQ